MEKGQPKLYKRRHTNHPEDKTLVPMILGCVRGNILREGKVDNIILGNPVAIFVQTDLPCYALKSGIADLNMETEGDIFGTGEGSSTEN